MSAAAKDLPLGSKVKVTNLADGRSTEVKVNDCLPAKNGRKIDLSKHAARQLGMIHNGTAPVKTTVVAAPPGAPTCN